MRSRASAKASYDAKYEGITRTTIDIVLLDRALARYGTDTAPARSLLREATMRGLNALWSESALQPSAIDFKGMAALEQLDRMVRELKPANDEQRAIQSQAQALSDELGRSIMLTLSHAGSTIPAVFLFVLAAWLVIFFTGIGLMSPRNAIAVTAVVAAAFTFSTAVFLILELDTPYRGVIQLSDAPLRLVLHQLAR